MPAALTQAVPGPNHQIVDRYGKPTPIWYPWLVNISDFVNGIASGELIVPGAITADLIAAGAITVEKIDATNIEVLSGTFGTLQTNDTTTRIQITDDDNELRCYIDGVLIASIGANAVSNGAFIAATSPSASWYPAEFSNTSPGGGALICASVGGYTIQSDQTTSSAGQHYAGSFRNSTGGQGVIGASSGNGSYAFFASVGTYGPFTGSHPGLLRKSETPEPGDILIDGEVIGKSLNDVICTATRSMRACDPAAIGVLSNIVPMHGDTLMPALGLLGKGEGSILTDAEWDRMKAAHDYCTINAVGEGCINVCGEGGNIAKGDLIVTSSMPGKGMKQSDDIVRSYTVARAREAVTFTSPTATAQIACIYLSG